MGEALRRMQGEAGVRVGVQGDDEVAVIAAVHEFGSDDGTIPERSYLRSTFDEQRDALLAALEESVGQAIDGKVDLEKGLEKLGETLVEDIRRKIQQGIAPDLDEDTIEAKGNDTPLIDTGRLLEAITAEMVP